MGDEGSVWQGFEGQGENVAESYWGLNEVTLAEC